MHSHLITRTIAVAAGLAAALGGAAGTAAATAAPGTTGDGHAPGIKHVLLISVDGMHQSDLDWFVASHPRSELARWPRAAPSTPARRPPTRRTPTRPAPG